MSFNIRYGLADDGDNCWDNRKSLALARIQAFEPDLLGLQECRDDAQAEFIKSAQILQRWTHPAVLSRPLIVTGDFNADKASAAYRLLTRQGALFAAYRQIHPGEENAATFHGFGQPEALAPIDWILASGHFRIVDAAIDRTHNGNVYPSDHYPITAGLDWKA